jgi:phosphate-selective porin OprO and OprP
MPYRFLAALLLAISALVVYSQEPIAAREMPYFTFGKGIGMAPPDSSFLINIRFRMQNRIAFNTNGGSDFDVEDAEARVRRLRLRFDGFAYDPRLTYVIQLSFTRGDMDYDALGFPNIVRDAMIFYAVSPKLTLGMGQTKLPGNRQRVNSSGDLQFPDRSIVNAAFNVDRDFGLQAYFTDHIGKMFYVLRCAVSSGEGRNFNTASDGLAFTGRVELLPFGKFQNTGDYFEGDLMREPTPKVSIAFGASNNQNAQRTGGQLGKYLYEPRDIHTTMADFLLKYRGFAFASEVLIRNTQNPITTNEDDEVSYVLVGDGVTAQASYLFKSNFEIAARYSQLTPRKSLFEYEDIHRQYSMGMTKYLKGHRVKIQMDGGYDQKFTVDEKTELPDNWFVRFQVELGI